jgi:hypothetical protein
MSEGFKNNYDDNPYDQAEQPLDYAEQRRMEREAEKQAREEAYKLERETKTKTERETRIAKQLARSAAKREDMSKKADTVDKKIDAVKDNVKEAEKIVKDATAEDLPKPIEIANFGENNNNNVWSDEKLESGTDVTLDLGHHIEAANAATTLAEDVAAEARQLEARNALLQITQNDIGEHAGSGEFPVYDLGGESALIRDRLREAWGLPPVNLDEGFEGIVSIGHARPGSVAKQDAEQLANTEVDIDMQSKSEQTSESTLSGNYGGSDGTSRTETSAYTQAMQTGSESNHIENRTNPGAILAGAATFAGGIFAGSAKGVKNIKNILSRSTSELKSDTSALKREIVEFKTDVNSKLGSQTKEAIAEPMQTHDTIAGINTVFELPKIDVLRPQAPIEPLQSKTPDVANIFPEIGSSNQSLIPQWVKQIDKDVKQNKIVELRKWQRDVLRAQYPDLLKKYDIIDQKAKEQIMLQTKELATQPKADTPTQVVQQYTEPGNLPSLVPAQQLPGTVPPLQSPVTTLSQNLSPYQRAMKSGRDGSFSMSDYVTRVLVGGILLGALLIVIFGF